jgi:hypothetical protein
MEGLYESKILFELFVGDPGLFQDAPQSALVNLAVHWHNATLGASAQNGMTAFLAAENKPEPCQSLNRLGPRDRW